MPIILNNPLLQYHPIRFCEVRKDFIAEGINVLLSSYKSSINQVFFIPDGIQREANSTHITSFIRQMSSSTSNELYPTYARKIYKLAKEYHSKKNQVGINYTAELLDLLTNNEYVAFEHYASFSLCGSNIFEFSKYLLDFFAQTDVDNVLLKDIRLPFQTIYLHFGKQENKKIKGSITSLTESLKQADSSQKREDICFFLDGAYISQCPDTGTLKVTLTSVKNKRSKYTNNSIDCYEDLLACELLANSANTTIHEAVDEQRKIRFESSQSIIQQKKDAGRFTKFFVKEENVNKTFNEISNYLKLVINCVLYLQSYPDDIEEGYTHSAPKKLVEQTLQTKEASAAAQKKLNQRGYRKIKFCGKKRQQFWQFEDEDVSEPLFVGAVASESKRNMSPHKRRAHIRKQRYGKELQSWRYVWIKETTIHKEKYQQAPTLYRIYEVAD